MARTLLLVAAVLMLNASMYRAQAQEDHAVSLTIRLIDHTPVFHVGETIGLELMFNASGSDTYEIDMRGYDRRERPGLEGFLVTPNSRDPLMDYFASGRFFGGGLNSGPIILNGAPQTLHEDLNEWIVLDQPGHYELYVNSVRVARRVGAKGEPVVVRSNPIEFDIVAADTAWTQQKLLSVTGVLGNTSSSQDERAAALRTLRFLNSASAVPELVRLLGTLPDGQRWDCIAGLFGSPNRELVIQTLEQQMRDPDIALTQDYIRTLATLKFHPDRGSLGPIPQNDPQLQKAWHQRAQADAKQASAVRQSLWERAALLVQSKRGRARAVSIRDLLQALPTIRLPERETAAAFRELSAAEQNRMLSGSWERIKSRAMLDPLVKILRQPNLQDPGLRDEALRRLFDLDSDEGAAQILAEIRKPLTEQGYFPVKVETLGLLPNETLPQVDELLATRLERKNSTTFDLDAQLVGRYATSAIRERIKASYEARAGDWDCVAEDGFVLYFLRVDPDYGVQRLAAAPSACMDRSLQSVIRMKRWNEIEPSIIRSLNDPDLNRARQAADTLGKYGGPEAEKAMWTRLQSFHEQWVEREEDLANRANMPRNALDATSFQFGLVEALGRARGWLLTDEQVTELEHLTLGQERENVKGMRWKSPVELTVSGFADAGVSTRIGPSVVNDLAALRGKLAQFPPGTRFQLITFSETARIKPVKQAIYETAAEHGLTIQEP